MNPLSALKTFLFLFLLCSFQSIFAQADSDLRNDLVIQGETVAKKSYTSKDRSTIYTVNWIKPDRILNGASEYTDSIPVVTLGGITEQGGLAVTHSVSIHKGYKYILSLRECSDCLDEFIVYQLSKVIPEFQHERYLQEQNKWLNTSSSGTVKAYAPCSSFNSINNLDVSFGNVYVTSIDNQQVTGYVDIKTKTNNGTKMLYEIASKIKYDDQVFGQYAVSSQSISASPTNPISQQFYNTSVSDQTADKASFSMSKNSVNQTNALLVNPFFQSMVRISFTIPTIALASAPQQLSDLLYLENLSASYICDGKVTPFDNINIIEKPIGIVFAKKLVGLTYTIENVTFDYDNDKYQFTIFVSSPDDTELRQSSINLSYNTSTFFQNQASSGFASIVNEPGTIATDFSDYDLSINDNGNNALTVMIGDIGTANPNGTYATIGSTPVALVRLEMTTLICDSNPMLAFEEFLMQENSYFFDSNQSDFPIAYDPITATDNETVHPCGCAVPNISSFSPTIDIIAGDNEILTITGSNFGVFERTGNPSASGVGSSVLFKNGDYTVGGFAPEFIAAAEEDFIIDGILEWTDTQIKVRVPSTDFEQGVNGTAATGLFKVRTGCNQEDTSPSGLRIPYSKMNFRVDDEEIAKKIGLRNDNGNNGDQNGYEFQFVSVVDQANIDIRGAFDDALTAWCDVTNIRFRKKDTDAPFGTMSNINDGINLIAIGGLPGDAEAALTFGINSLFYFDIDCNGSDPNDLDGGYIMTDLDIIIDGTFAAGTDQDRAVEVLTHELGHGHMLNHAFCIGGSCVDPMMHPQGNFDIQNVDEDGALRVFDDSNIIIQNGCSLNGSTITPTTIKNGLCGSTTATDEIKELTLSLSPVPTFGKIYSAESISNASYLITDTKGQVLEVGELLSGKLELDISPHPAGTYILTIQNEDEIGHFKIIKI